MKSLKSRKKVIRDTVHGDIVFDERYIDVIDTPEFQRLKRIKQLSTADSVFPTASHTRFSHSIGTYYVMGRLIDHFLILFKKGNQEFSQESIDLLLMVALLHDVGHGPFSHAFEGALPKEKYKKDHEEWTREIITHPSSNIYKALAKNFGKEFPDQVAALIKKEKDIKHDRVKANDEELDLFFIMSSLISSHLDADRMDYLLRDSFFTGVTQGNFDINRLIKALTITVKDDNKYYVCIDEKYLSSIEEYILARYQMHNSVYLHPFKVEMEILIKKILRRAEELYLMGILNTAIPNGLKCVFDNKELRIEDYILLDDSIMIALFAEWQKNSDDILRILCEAFLHRKKCTQIDILDNKFEDIREFEGELLNILNKHEFKLNTIDDAYFWIVSLPENKDKCNNVVYKTKDGNVWVIGSDGTIADLMKKSKLIHSKLDCQKNAAFINYDILKCYAGNYRTAKEEIDNLIKHYNNRNRIEIEKKYYIDDKDIFDRVLTVLTKWGKYRIDNNFSPKMQVDSYYDTEDLKLFNNDQTLRFRQKDNQYILTIKAPAKDNGVLNNERFEYEKTVSSEKLEQQRSFLEKYMPIIEESDLLQKTMIIENNRKKVILTDDEVLFEMVFDDVKYINAFTRKVVSEYQIEIEVKSEYLHRINLKKLTDYLEEKVPELVVAHLSKYNRGWILTNQK